LGRRDKVQTLRGWAAGLKQQAMDAVVAVQSMWIVYINSFYGLLLWAKRPGG
jgi:hypothetical protein